MKQVEMWSSVCGHIFIILLYGSYASGTYYENKTSLITSKLSGYNRYVRPVNDQSMAVAVNITMNLYNLVEVDTVQGVITLVVTMSCTWIDERMTWTPSDYNYIDSIEIEQQYVWTPPLQSAQPVDFDSIGQKWMKVVYHQNGRAYWNPGGAFKASCTFDMKYWPFDEQECQMSYIPYDYGDDAILLKPVVFTQTFYSGSAEWSLESTTTSTSNRYGVTEAVFTLKLNRRAAFFVQTLLVPLVVLMLLSSLVFYLPSDSGERVGYCITIMLSLTVFLDVISSEIPKLSNPVPVICEFLFIGIIECGSITLAVIFNLAIYHRSDTKPIGRVYKKLVHIMCRGENQVHAENKEIEQKGLSEKYPADQNKDTIGIGHGLRTDKTNKHVIEEPYITWQEVSCAIDMILFILTTLMSVALVLAMILKLSLNI